MDMPMNVPVDNPNADTEWQVCTFRLTAHVLLATDFSQERHTAEAWHYSREAAISDTHDRRGHLGGSTDGT